MHTSIVLGTAREGRQSEKVSRLLFEEFKKQTIHTIEHVDVRDCITTCSTIRYDDETGRGYPWYQSAMRSDAFIFVIPEYNHGYPGEWKLLMDSLYKKPYIGKVAGLVGVSNGQFGGVRALEAATLSLAARGMYVMKDSLHFPFVETQFDDSGTVRTDEQIGRVQKFIDLFLLTISKST